MSTRGKGTSETKAIIKCGLPSCYRLSPRRQNGAESWLHQQKLSARLRAEVGSHAGELAKVEWRRERFCKVPSSLTPFYTHNRICCFT